MTESLNNEIHQHVKKGYLFFTKSLNKLFDNTKIFKLRGIEAKQDILKTITPLRLKGPPTSGPNIDFWCTLTS